MDFEYVPCEDWDLPDDGACVEVCLYRDDDGDGFGVEETTQLTCDPEEAHPGWTAQAGDCAPDDDLVFPGARETCNILEDAYILIDEKKR